MDMGKVFNHPEHPNIKIGGTYTLNRDVALNEETILFRKGEKAMVSGQRDEIAGRLIIHKYKMVGMCDIVKVGEAYVFPSDFVECD